MPIHIPRLRRWFAVGAIGLSMVVVGMYLYARWRVHDALKDVPNKLGIEVQQSTENFSISKSEQGRTLFTVRASKAVQYKEGGRAELHNVSIILYGRDSSRFDQIYGADFEYDPQSGNVDTKGEVQIDLEANPQGLSNPDQSAPKEVRNPIHLRTSGLVFNQKTGDAYTKQRVEFSGPQATGSALGVSYVAKTNVLTLDSQVEMLLSGPSPARITAAHGVINKDPREVVLNRPRMIRGEQKLEAERATLFLRPDDTVERALAQGGVNAEVHGRSEMHARAAQAEVLLNRKQDSIRSAVFSGDVQIDSAGRQPISGSAGSVLLDFSGKNRLEKIHAQDGVKLVQQKKPAPFNPASLDKTASANALEITAPAMDFFVADGSRLDRAQTSGAAQIAILQPTTTQRTLITAGKFEARFGNKSNGGTQLVSLHGEPDARIINTTPGQPDRVSTSNLLDVTFRPAGGIDSIVQRGNVTYVDGDRRAWADNARYTPGDQILQLTGSPRVVQSGMSSTALTIRFNRATGDAFAEGDVKSTYNELKEQPGGALFAASDPIHVTSRSMQAHRTAATALYSGNARLWQNANVVEAPSIEFDRDRRTVTARGNATQPVSTVLLEAAKARANDAQQNADQPKNKSLRATPVTITANRLSYADNDRRAHFESNVVVKGADVTITANQMDAFLLSRNQNSGNQAANSPSPLPGTTTGTSQLDRIVATGNVILEQPSRHATGQQLVYFVQEEKYVLTGGPPSIFDAEHGKITGDSLTFFSRDDRVLVEGGIASPTVTQTRVAR
jgi:lipopolysaccharide export system protein LptA